MSRLPPTPDPARRVSEQLLATMTVGSLARLYGTTVAALILRLGPFPSQPLASTPREGSTRAQILALLQRGPVSVSQLAKKCPGISRQSVYTRVSAMTKAGEIRRIRQGVYAVASVSPSQIITRDPSNASG